MANANANNTVNFAAGEKKVEMIPLADIQTSQNPRLELRGVLEQFHLKGAAHHPVESRLEWVKFMDVNFPYIRDRLNSMVEKGQIQPVMLRRYDSKGEDKYGIVVGECRILAWAILEAETGKQQKVRAIIAPKMTLDEAFDLALTENIERQDMTPLEIGVSFQELLTNRINPATVKPTLTDGTVNPSYDPKFPKGRPYTLKEIATKFRKDYNWVRGRAALPYLPEKDKLQLTANFRAGKRDVTRYVQKALQLAVQAKKTGGNKLAEVEEISHENGNVGNVENSSENGVANTTNSDTIAVVQQEIVVKAETRRRVSTLKEVLEMFDKTPLTNIERLQALADVMKLDLNVALQERTERLDQQQLAEARKADREAVQQQTQTQETQVDQTESKGPAEIQAA
jgi:hypothetical protein